MDRLVVAVDVTDAGRPPRRRGQQRRHEPLEIRHIEGVEGARGQMHEVVPTRCRRPRTRAHDRRPRTPASCCRRRSAPSRRRAARRLARQRVVDDDDPPFDWPSCCLNKSAISISASAYCSDPNRASIVSTRSDGGGAGRASVRSCVGAPALSSPSAQDARPGPSRRRPRRRPIRAARRRRRRRRAPS